MGLGASVGARNHDEKTPGEEAEHKVAVLEGDEEFAETVARLEETIESLCSGE